MNDQINEKHPLIKENWSTFLFLNAAYDGKKRWFKDYGDNTDCDLKLAKCFLPLETIETLEEFKSNYSKRLKRSRWKPLLKETIKTFCGILSNYSLTKETISWLNQEKRQEYLDNLDLEGNNHFAFFSECDRLALLEGWCAVWVNFSKADQQPENYYEQQLLDYRSYLQIIKRSQIINFDSTRLNNGQKILTRLVYEEEIYREGKKVKRYIEILRSAVNIYEETKDKSAKTKIELIEENAYDLPYIPIVFYPVNNVNPWENDFPFLDIAEDNRTHYQIYSDYRESLHYHSLPIFARIGVLEPGQDPSSLNPLIISPYAVLDLPSGGDCKVVETSGTAINLNKESLKDIENDVISKALNFIDNSNAMTATEASLRSIQFKANFDVYAAQKTSAISEIFNIVADWSGQEQQNQGIMLNDAIFKLTSPDLIRQFKELMSEGFLDIETFWKLLDYWGTLPKGIDVTEIIKKVNGTIRQDQAFRETIEPENIGVSSNGNGA
ncbi:MAG: DUF4055 domain-containing protein [Crocosphaera sp.]|nr:DUF4055 domain-containing protein [Crocosphaera sp.]